MKYKIFLEKWNAVDGINRSTQLASSEADLQTKIAAITSDKPEDLIRLNVVLDDIQ